MSQQLNNLFSQTILYYCYQQSNKYYDKYANQCGLYKYDDLTGNLYIEQWYINNEVPEPSLNSLVTLCAENFENIQSFYYYHYYLPGSIKDNFPFMQMTQNDLMQIPQNQLKKGYYIFNKTSECVMQFNGTEWINV